MIMQTIKSQHVAEMKHCGGLDINDKTLSLLMKTLPSPPYSGQTPPESGEFGGTQIRRETVLSKYFSHTFQHQITPEYQRNITVLPLDSHRNLMKTSVQHRTPTGLRR